MPLTLDDIRDCLEGAIPGVMATCAPDGTPNVAYLSQVDYVDARHVALSFQFFNKTRRNVLADPRVEILVAHPLTGALYRLRARYLATQTEGPLFERMKAKLSGIASHSGMAGVFHLLGSDVYEVTDIDRVRKADLPSPTPGVNRLAALRRCTEALHGCCDLDGLLEALLDGLARELHIEHALVLVHDAAAQRLYTVASRGYGRSGVGSEIGLGEGVIGVAARQRVPVRVSHLTSEQAYMQAVREHLPPHQPGDAGAAREIPWPGLAEPHSQLAVPLLACGELVGVLFVESEQDLRFSYDDEDALVALGGQLAACLRQLQDGEAADAAPTPGQPVEPRARHGVPQGSPPGPPHGPPHGSQQGSQHGSPQGTPSPPPAQPAATPLHVRYYEQDGSVFFDGDYIIKGVAGAVLWTLLSDHAASGRCEFTNRELRLDPRVRLPDVADNLEARLVLLARRLAERGGSVQLAKAGRGRLRLEVGRPLLLQVLGA